MNGNDCSLYVLFSDGDKMGRLSDAIWFRLGGQSDSTGVSCGEDGIFVGGVPLLARRDDKAGESIWIARRSSELNNELSAAYGLPVDMTAKAGGIAVAAGA